MVTAGSRLDWPIAVQNRNQRLCVFEVDSLTQMFGYTAHVQRDNESSPKPTAVMVVREQEDVPQLPFQDITTDELKYLKL